MDSSRIDEVDQLELNLLEGKGYSALVSPCTSSGLGNPNFNY